MLRSRALLQQDVVNGRRESKPNVTRSVTEDVDAVIKLNSEAEAAIHDGNMSQALQKYTTIVKEHSDLALAERARIKRALMLYETGAVEQALLELEDEEVALRGNAEVHAALAALLYAEKPSERQRAEQQWEVCSEFDNRSAF
ncbi:g3430 [Coccomyxa viridis]|uniref:G3430 protein n=1 Tax=Coccomyxa viridis TaxID=1274662 RepID=A0ABP1FMT3_9CHLO